MSKIYCDIKAQLPKNIQKMIKIYLSFLKLKHVKRLQICLSLMLKLLDMSEIYFDIYLNII